MSSSLEDYVRSFAAKPTIDQEVRQGARDLEHNIVSLRKQLDEQANALQKERAGVSSQAQRIKELETTVGQLAEKERLSFLLNRVNSVAQKALLTSESFRKGFLENTECDAFVMSVDIRRSTELMLKARRPDHFAKFITALCADLEALVKNSYGVFDKFTGDGILAFFPTFFSGDDAGFWAVMAAGRCHESFARHYRDFRGSFISILKNVGLGVGIDYGPVHLVQMAGGLTVVGAPVVYACRMAGAPCGVTLLNQPAYEKISGKFGAYCSFYETQIELKHEGQTLSYEVSLNGKEFMPMMPDWKSAPDIDPSA
jgi:class 3 adenylate cyclase